MAQMQTFTVAVPEGTTEGTTFQVSVSGSIFDVICPKGAKGGQNILVELPVPVAAAVEIPVAIPVAKVVGTLATAPAKAKQTGAPAHSAAVVHTTDSKLRLRHI